MSDSYDATYSAVSNALSYVMPHLQQEIYWVSESIRRPSVLYRPKLEHEDGDHYIAHYGDVVGCGKSPADAMADFDLKWSAK